MNKKIIVIGLIIFLIASVFSGCIDDNKKDNSDDTGKTYTINTNYPRDRLGLNEDGETAFMSACSRYGNLKSNLTDEEARSALVDELNNGFEFVKEASLSDDGYTIGIVFEDDTAALMFTYNGLFDNASNGDNSSQFSGIFDDGKTNNKLNQNVVNIIAQEIQLPPIASDVDSSDFCEDFDFIVPQNRKVIYFQADEITALGSNLAQIKIVKEFEKYGWKRTITSETDFKLVGLLGLYDWSVTPDELFNCSGKGIIIYSGRGGFYPIQPDAIPGEYYIECSFQFDLEDAMKADFEEWKDIVGENRYNQYLTWRDQGRLIFTGFETERKTWRWGYTMDVDLIEEEGEVDTGAMVFFLSCNGWKAKNSYMALGAGCFIGWDGLSIHEDSYEALSNMLDIMINSDIPETASNALIKLPPSIRKSAKGGTIKIEDNSLDFYLPSFGKMIINLDTSPGGASKYKLDFFPYGSAEKTSISPGEEFEYDGVCPVNTIITITAVSSSGNALDSGVLFPSLISGENPLMTITEWEPYGIILEADPSTVDSDGISTSTLTATLKTFDLDDVVEPTGTPLPCKEVEFITNFGSFVGETKVLTDINGQAKIKLKSDKDGIATVRAIVEYDGIESYKTQNITFGEVPYSFRLVQRRTQQTDGSGDIIDVMSWGYYLVFKGKQGIDYYMITRTCPDYEKEYSTDGKLPYEDEYYKDLRILTDEERFEWQEEYDEGYRFFLFRGKPVSISETSDAWKTTLSDKQNYLMSSLNECTFTIEAYNS